jgi:hypothetical protein
LDHSQGPYWRDADLQTFTSSPIGGTGQDTANIAVQKYLPPICKWALVFTEFFMKFAAYSGLLDNLLPKLTQMVVNLPCFWLINCTSIFTWPSARKNRQFKQGANHVEWNQQSITNGQSAIFKAGH